MLALCRFPMAAAIALLATPAFALPINNGPPPGGRELADMADIGTAHSSTTAQPIPTLVTLRFVASAMQTRFSFNMRADHSTIFGLGRQVSSEIFLDNVSIEQVNPTTNVVLTGNLITNGDFEGATEPTNLPTGWTFDQPEGPFGLPSGLVTAPDQTPIAPGTHNRSFVSFADDEYNSLSQTLATIPGATYEIGFTVGFTDDHPRDEFGLDHTDYLRQAIEDTDGRQLPDGLDLVLSATNVHGRGDWSGGGVPEPAAWALMIMGLGGVGALARGRRGPHRVST